MRLTLLGVFVLGAFVGVALVERGRTQTRTRPKLRLVK